MAKFFAPNLGTKGRLLRGAAGVGLIAAGLLTSAEGRWTCAALVAAGGFVLYEAVRGWCIMRACGIKTKL